MTKKELLAEVTQMTRSVKERIERAVLKKYMENRNNA